MARSFLKELNRRNVFRIGVAYVVTAWLLIQVAETIFPLFGFDDTPARIVVVVLAIGFIPALVFAWAFELTPEGIKLEKDVDRGGPATARSGKTLDRVIALVLALGLACFAFDKFVLDPVRDTEMAQFAREEGRADALVESFGEKSIVVLPFVNISADPEQEYLGDGLAEELLNLLAGVEGLRVISRTSAFSFKGTDVTSGEIARQLNVSYVLEGSVRKSGDRLRVTAQLIDARADAHVWSETYDHSSEDIFDIQDAVAGEVVGRLKEELSLDPPRAERHDPAAYALYLQARQLGNRQGTGDSRRELLERALELEPGYLDAMVELAWVHRGIARAAEWSGDIESAERHREQYPLLIDEVLALEPGHPGGNASRAWNSLSEADFHRAAMYVERALESEPTHFGALTTAGELLTRLWRAEEAIPILRYASERDPLNANHFDNLAGAYLDAGRYALAEEAYRMHVVLAPDAPAWQQWGIGLALLLQGKASEALQCFEDNIGADHPLRWHGKTLALHDLGRADDSRLELARLLEVDPDTPNIHWFIGTAHAWIGAMDDAFGFFEKQREEDPAFFGSMADSPLYGNLRGDPRWLPFLASVGLDPESLASVAFNPRLPSEIRLRKDAATR